MWYYGDKCIPGQAPIEPMLFNGEVIPKVDEYIYLSVEFNNLLDTDMMAEH